MGDWGFFGKILIYLGAGVMLIGLILWGLSSIFQIGRLPGDIFYQKGNFTIYFPLATSILISIILTIVLNLTFRR